MIECLKLPTFTGSDYLLRVSGKMTNIRNLRRKMGGLSYSAGLTPYLSSWDTKTMMAFSLSSGVRLSRNKH